MTEQAQAPQPAAGETPAADSPTARPAPGTTAGDGGRSGRRRLRRWPWLGPAIVLTVVVVAYPAVEVVRTSLLNISSIGLARGFAGTQNYVNLLRDPALGQVIGNTIRWVVVVVGVTIVLSLGLAQLLNARFAGRRFVRWALIVPWASSLVMTATVWRYIYERDYGLLNRLLLDLGLIEAPIDWFREPELALWSLIVIGIIVSIPFTTYVFLSGLQGIPGELYEAAKIDGAGPWQHWRRITLPLLRPALVVAISLNTIYVFNSFPIIWVITGRFPGTDTDTTITYLYKVAFTTELDPGKAGALSVVNVVFLLLVVGWYVRRFRGDERGGPARRRGAGSLGRLLARPREAAATAWRPVSRRLSRGGVRVLRAWTPVRGAVLPLFGVGVALFFLAPYAVMAVSALKGDQDLFASPALYLPTQWQWDNFIDVWSAIALGDYLRASLIIALGATAIVLLVSVPAAYLVARHEFRGRRVFLYGVLVTQMFAPVALVIGIYREVVLVDSALGSVSDGWGAMNTFWAMILINAAFNLAFSIWILHGYFASIPRDIEEAGMVDGLGRIGVLRRIVLPLARPGIVTAVIFTFVQVWNEFVIARTIFNDPVAGRQTLTVGITQFVGLYETQYQYLFAASLIGIVPVVLLFVAIERHLMSGLTAGSVK